MQSNSNRKSKGGVGKTITTVNLGIGLARRGKKGLLMDTDPQGSMTASLGYIEPDEIRVTLANKLMDIINEGEGNPKEGILHHDEGVDLVPANIELSALEVSLINVLSRERILRSYVDILKDEYDYILIDCMPSLGMMTINALAAADIKCAKSIGKYPLLPLKYMHTPTERVGFLNSIQDGTKKHFRVKVTPGGMALIDVEL